jgi:hypothetical protein
MKSGEAVDPLLKLARDEVANSTPNPAAAATPSLLQVGQFFLSLTCTAILVMNCCDIASLLSVGSIT